ncbi:MAG: hypothetical protein PHQ19_09595 [Candidatus Krumholzibacteria bacterium]|nr:hypothetical protein [Candidatus Krumholzibacteria bacterium]
MNGRSIATVLIIALVGLSAAGCGRDSGTLEPAKAPTDPVVFDDDFAANVDFQAFLGSDLYALTIDALEKHDGVSSLKFVVPPPDQWVGGAFTTGVLRNLTGYDALTFWAKSSEPSTLNVAGLGNDNTGTSKYTAEWSDIALTTDWAYYIIPIPLPEKLTLEGGLFFIAEAPEDADGHTIWFDQVIFRKTGLISDPRPVIDTKTMSAFVGATVNVTGTRTTFDVDGTDQTIVHMPGYFTFTSSADTVVSTDGGVIKAVGAGTATVTAALGATPATGELTVNVAPAPTVPAPTPTHPAGDVISLFSDTYTDIDVDTWSADWPDMADVADFAIAGNNVKAYTNLVYAGIEFTSVQVDATAMTHFSLDVWVPEGVTYFRVKLVDFGEDGVYGGAPDSEKELTFTTSSPIAIVPGSWATLDIPLADFMGPSGLIAREHLAQLIISGGPI